VHRYRHVTLVAASALTLGAPLLDPAAGATAAGACAVPERPALCRSFAAFRRARGPDDRLPAIFRDAPPLRLVDQRSSRRVGAEALTPHRFFLLGGRRYMCLVEYSTRERGGGFACSGVRDVLAGRVYLSLACEPRPRRHRLLFLQPMPDGVPSATLHRVGKPAIRFAVEDNLLVADLPVPARAYLPTKVVWRRDGRRQERRLPVDDLAVTCRA
jgi:hypothetical protein